MSIYCARERDEESHDCTCGLPEYWEHLQPSYRPEWGDGQIHLNGELDFPADAKFQDIVDSFDARAGEIGAWVRVNDGHLFAQPGMAPVDYELIPGDDGTIEKIICHLEKTHECEAAIEHVDIQRLIDIDTELYNLVKEHGKVEINGGERKKL